MMCYRCRKTFGVRSTRKQILHVITEARRIRSPDLEWRQEGRQISLLDQIDEMFDKEASDHAEIQDTERQP